jgi:hypothetical protein
LLTPGHSARCLDIYAHASAASFSRSLFDFFWLPAAKKLILLFPETKCDVHSCNNE